MFQLGSLHIPTFAVFSAVGLMAALALSQRTALYVCLEPEAVWNAGLTAIVSAFVISRLLLIVFSFNSFLQYPLLVLALPSLTSTSILITAVFMLGYIRWRKLPLLPLLDAAAPCAVLLWAFRSLGRIVDGTRDGMPVHIRVSHNSVHPVEFYTLISASVLWISLLFMLRSKIPAGQAAAVAFIFAGGSIFFIDFFRLPSSLLATSPLDPSQIIGLAMIFVGTALLLRALA